MNAIRECIGIDLPVERVFRLAARPEDMPRWNSAVVRSELRGRLREGATVVQRIRLLGRQFETTFRVTRYPLPHSHRVHATANRELCARWHEGEGTKNAWQLTFIHRIARRTDSTRLTECLSSCPLAPIAIAHPILNLY